MRTQIAMLVWVLAGCGKVEANQSDAGMPNASMPDASSICAPTGTFDIPVHLTEFNTLGVLGVARLTADELELYYDDAIGTAPSTSLYRAQRSAIGQPFGALLALTQVNTGMGDANASVSSDGLVLFFESYRLPGQGLKLFVSTRTSRIGEFGAPSKVANVNSTTVTDNDAHPFVTADGQELWFISNRAGGLGNYDIYHAVWNGSSFTNIAAAPELSTNATDFLPTLSADKLTVYVSSNRPGGKGSFDIWTAHRSTTSDGFPAPRLVPELNSSATDLVGWLSPDNCRLYFSSDVAGTPNLYVATRHPL